MATSPSAEESAGALATRRHGDVVIASPRGRIDHGTAEAFKAALALPLDACRPGHPLVLDLGGVDYIASIGLRVLMLAARQAKAQGGAIVIAGLSGLVREIFEISKFTLVFPCYPGVTEALTALDAGPGPSAERR